MGIPKDEYDQVAELVAQSVRLVDISWCHRVDWSCRVQPQPDMA